MILGHFLLLFILPFAISSKCNAGEAFIFVNLHHSVEEAKHMKETAAALGQKYVEIPAPGDELLLGEEGETLNKEISKLDRVIVAEEKPGFRKMHAPAYLAEIRRKRESLIDERESADPMAIILKKHMESLRESHYAITTLSISGHDGDGNMHGDNDSLHLDQLEKYIPADAKKEIKNIALMGCYAGTRLQVARFKSFLPNLNMVLGYDGSAPKETTPASGLYIKESLLAAKEIESEKDQSKLKATIDRLVPSMRNLSATMYLGGQCQKFYSKRENDFSSISFTDCKRRMDDFIKNDLPSLEKYYTGELPIPSDTQNGPLRQIYTHFRQSEHCFVNNKHMNEIYASLGMQILDGQKLLHLLFWKNYSKNAGKFISQFKGVNPIELANQIKECESSSADLNLKKGCPSLKYFQKLTLQIQNDPQYFSKMDRRAAAALSVEIDRKSENVTEYGQRGSTWYFQALFRGKLFGLDGPFEWHEEGGFEAENIRRRRPLRGH